MGRIFSAVIEDAAISVATDLFQIEGDVAPCILHYITISQTLDVGDAAAENVPIKIRRVTDALTTGATLNKHDTGDSNATADVIVNDSTQLVTGAATIFSESWNIALPFIWQPTEQLRIIVPSANVVVVTMAAPADSLTINATLIWEEVGSA